MTWGCHHIAIILSGLVALSAAVPADSDGAARPADPALAAKVAALGPVNELPRLGNWIWPGKDQEKLKKLYAMGVGFTSSYDPDLEVGRWLYVAGIATNCCPGRPSGSELIAGLGLTAEDMDQDSQGRRMGEGMESAVFHEAVPERYCQYVRDRIRSVANAPWVASFTLSSPVSMYGEVHYAASTGGQYAVFSRPAKANFRRWLKGAHHNDLTALSRAWGHEFKTWNEIDPPDGQKADPGGIDTRQSWSDFIHWYNWWLDEITRLGLEAARKETDKPVAAMIGGPKVGYNQGIALGNVGPVVRMLGRVKPAFFNDTDAQTLFSARYTRAACSQYGVEQMQEHVGPPYLQVFHQYNMVLNVLSCGADHVHLAHLGELFDNSHWFRRTWRNLAPIALRYRTGYRKSDAVMFHSYMTSWYRPSRSNADTVILYDSTNTLWTPDSGYPSWGRALGSPDVADDAMIEDGALNGRKLLVIPNTSITVTSRKAVEAIRGWVRGGGTLIGFGEGCLGYTVEESRSLEPTPGMAGLVPASKIEEAKRDPSAVHVDQQVGKGRAILYLKPADVSLKNSSGKRFVDEMMPVLESEADKAGVRRWCWADKEHLVNLLYCGKDLKSGKHLFTADFTRMVRDGLRDAIFHTDRSFTFTFDASLTGDADLVGITDSFEKCDGGTVEYDARKHTLIVHFVLPGKLTLTFGKGTSGLAVARRPLLLWEGDDLILRPSGGYGLKQTQEPVRVTSDGDLAPCDATMPYLIHGDMHRAEFGGGPTFRLSLSRPGWVTVHVNSVSAPVVLIARLDGKEAFRQELPNKDNAQNPFAKEYDQDFTIEVPTGEHDVKIDNLGADWLSVDRYVFRGL